MESFIKENLENSKSPDDKVAAYVSSVLLGMNDEVVFSVFDEFIKSKRPITHNGYTTSEREVATNLFGSMKFQSYDQLKLYRGKVGSELEVWSISSALSNLRPSEYLKYLGDPNTSDEKEMRRDFYSNLAHNSDEEVPYEMTPYLLKDLQSIKDLGGGGLYTAGRVISKMNLDEKQKNEVVDKILNEPFPQEAFRSFIWNFPESLESKHKTRYVMGLYKKDSEVFKDDASSYVYGLNEVSDAEKEMLKPLLSTEEDSWLQNKLKQLGVE